MSATTMHVCETCGTEFAPRPNHPSRYCTHRCRNEAQRFTIVPSETKGIRTKPFTDAEFHAELARIKRRRLQEAKPLYDPNALACGEKAGRIAAYEARMQQENAQDGRKGADRCAGPVRTNRTYRAKWLRWRWSDE